MKTIKIKDYYGKYHDVPVSDEFFEEWHLLQNETQRIRKKELYHRSGVPMDCVDEQKVVAYDEIDEMIDDMIRKEENIRLYEAISQLTPIQQRRVRMYMEHLSYSEIARREDRKFAVVYRSLHDAFERLRVLMSD